MVSSWSLYLEDVPLLPLYSLSKVKFSQLLIVSSGLVIQFKHVVDVGDKVLCVTSVTCRNIRNHDVLQVQLFPGGFYNLEEGDFGRCCFTKQMLESWSTYTLPDMVSAGHPEDLSVQELLQDCTSSSVNSSVG